MKHVISALLACLLPLGLTACFGGGDSPTAAPEQTTIAAPEPTTQVVEAATDPNFDAEVLFRRLEGIWDDEYMYPGFMSFIYRDGKPCEYSGVYDGEANQIGTMTGGESTGEGIAMLIFWYPAYNDVDDELVPERTGTMWIDLTNIDNGTIRIKRETYWGTKDWHNYTYNCKTLQDAGIKAF